MTSAKKNPKESQVLLAMNDKELLTLLLNNQKRSTMSMSIRISVKAKMSCDPVHATLFNYMNLIIVKFD